MRWTGEYIKEEIRFRVFMTVLRSILFTIFIFAVGCDQSPQIPGSPKQNYPVLIKDSSDRRANAEREWRRMLDAYSIQQTPPDLYPIIYTPRSLLGVSGGIKILLAKPEPGTENLAL